MPENGVLVGKFLENEGNNYSNAMDFEAYEGEVTYNLSEEYSMLI